jgi:hypothetical protein
MKKQKQPKRSPATFKRQITKLCKFLRWHFYLGAWKMNIIWKIDEYGKPKIQSDDYEDNSRVAAEIHFVEGYLVFDIFVYKTVFDMYMDGDIGDVFHVFIHEFCHSLTQPIYAFALDYVPEGAHRHFKMLWERQTETIANLLDCSEYEEISKLKRHLH